MHPSDWTIEGIVFLPVDQCEKCSVSVRCACVCVCACFRRLPILSRLSNKNYHLHCDWRSHSRIQCESRSRSPFMSSKRFSITSTTIWFFRRHSENDRRTQVCSVPCSVCARARACLASHVIAFGTGFFIYEIKLTFKLPCKVHNRIINKQWDKNLHYWYAWRWRDKLPILQVLMHLCAIKVICWPFSHHHPQLGSMFVE